MRIHEYRFSEIYGIKSGDEVFVKTEEDIKDFIKNNPDEYDPHLVGGMISYCGTNQTVDAVGFSSDYHEPVVVIGGWCFSPNWVSKVYNNKDISQSKDVDSMISSFI